MPHSWHSRVPHHFKATYPIDLADDTWERYSNARYAHIRPSDNARFIPSICFACFDLLLAITHPRMENEFVVNIAMKEQSTQYWSALRDNISVHDPIKPCPVLVGVHVAAEGSRQQMPK